MVLVQPDQALHQAARHVALEPAQAFEHGVEGARRLVQLPEEAARDRIDRRQVQVVDLLGALGQAPHRPGDLPADKAGDDGGDQRNGETDDDRPLEAQRLG
jgi:hypothetical protein